MPVSSAFDQQRLAVMARHGGAGRRRPAAGMSRLSMAATAAGVVLAAGASAASVIALDRMQNPAAVRDGVHATAHPQAVFLARSTLLALQHANLTEDYRVLWQLSAPSFQASNSPQRLAGLFAEFRRRRMDLSVAGLADPHWTEAPAIASDGQLKLKGYFPIPGSRLQFDIAFTPLDGLWKMTGLSVSVRPAMAETASSG